MVIVDMNLRLSSIEPKDRSDGRLLEIVYSSFGLFPSDFEDLVGVRLELGSYQMSTSSSVPRFKVSVVDVEVFKDGSAARRCWRLRSEIHTANQQIG